MQWVGCKRQWSWSNLFTEKDCGKPPKKSVKRPLVRAKARFDPRPIRMSFGVEGVALGQVVVRVLRFSLSGSSQQCPILVHSATIEAMKSQQFVASPRPALRRSDRYVATGPRTHAGFVH
jgi:hypothetical protein